MREYKNFQPFLEAIIGCFKGRDREKVRLFCYLEADSNKKTKNYSLEGADSHQTSLLYKSSVLGNRDY